MNTVASGAHKTTTSMKKSRKVYSYKHVLLYGSQQLIYVESRVTIASNPKGYKESNSVTN